jgi:ethanolamine phosphate transferase 2 subunit G
MLDSPNMPGKQRQMDGIVRDIYRAMETHSHLSSSLLVLSGDHGMNEAGNHGGSSAGEVSTALLFVSPKLKSAFAGLESPVSSSESFQFYDIVEQSDIAPTLAALLGFPIPRNNLGLIIPSFLKLWTQGMWLGSNYRLPD